MVVTVDLGFVVFSNLREYLGPKMINDVAKYFILKPVLNACHNNYFIR